METAPPPRLLIFSDLDGTLLDRDTYSFAPAQPALAALREHAVPVILATSKTLAETAGIREELDNKDPFVVENGGAAALPENYFSRLPNPQGLRKSNSFFLKHFGPEYRQILDVLHGLRRKHGFRFAGFSDWNDEKVADLTGLPVERATLARRRCCAEPILWEGDERSLEQFRKLLAAHGLRLLQGGRFLHVLGEFDKATAMAWLLERFQEQYPADSFVTVALGDSPNDADMLEAADVAVIIRSPRSEGMAVRRPRRVIRTQQPGPAGWREAVEAILDDFS